MTPGDVARVLVKAAAFDQRTIGEADVLAWHEILAPYELADALEAVTRHYRDSTDRIMPAQLRRLTIIVRDEHRRRALERSDALALPSRYEDDVTRDIRVQVGVARCREVVNAIRERLATSRRNRQLNNLPTRGTWVERGPGMDPDYVPPSALLHPAVEQPNPPEEETLWS